MCLSSVGPDFGDFDFMKLNLDRNEPDVDLVSQKSFLAFARCTAVILRSNYVYCYSVLGGRYCYSVYMYMYM